MRSFQEKRRVNALLYSRLTVFLLVLLILFFSRSVWNMYKKSQISKEAMRNSQAQLGEIEDRKKSLQTKINKLDTTAGVEAAIRERFQVVKPGEEMLIIVPSKDEKK